MKKSQIKKSLNSILPTKSQKEKMLDNILQHKKKNYLNVFKFSLIGLTVCICLITLLPKNEPNPNIRIMTTNFNIVLTYKNKDYCQGEIYTGSISKLTKQSLSSNVGGTIYKKGKLLFLENNNTYYELKICKGE